MKARLIYPPPVPSGVQLDLTMKEALKLRNLLLGVNKVQDPDGTLKCILDTLRSEDLLGQTIG